MRPIPSRSIVAAPLFPNENDDHSLPRRSNKVSTISDLERKNGKHLIVQLFPCDKTNLSVTLPQEQAERQSTAKIKGRGKGKGRNVIKKEARTCSSMLPSSIPPSPSMLPPLLTSAASSPSSVASPSETFSTAPVSADVSLVKSRMTEPLRLPQRFSTRACPTKIDNKPTTDSLVDRKKYVQSVRYHFNFKLNKEKTRKQEIGDTTPCSIPTLYGTPFSELPRTEQEIVLGVLDRLGTKLELNGEWSALVTQFREEKKTELQQKLEHLQESPLPIPCPVFNCNFNCLGLPGVKSHLHIHFKAEAGIYDVKCKFCGGLHNKLHNIMTHYQHVHLKMKEAICKFCGKGFGTTNSMKQHEYTHWNEEELLREDLGVVCQTCGKVCIKKMLRDHEVQVHGKGEQLLCPVCGATKNTKRHMNEHLMTHMSPEERVEFEEKWRAEKARSKMRIIPLENPKGKGRNGNHEQKPPEVKKCQKTRSPTEIARAKRKAEGMRRIRMRRRKEKEALAENKLQLQLHPESTPLPPSDKNPEIPDEKTEDKSPRQLEGEKGVIDTETNHGDADADENYGEFEVEAHASSPLPEDLDSNFDEQKADDIGKSVFSEVAESETLSLVIKVEAVAEDFEESVEGNAGLDGDVVPDHYSSEISKVVGDGIETIIKVIPYSFESSEIHIEETEVKIELGCDEDAVDCETEEEFRVNCPSDPDFDCPREPRDDGDELDTSIKRRLRSSTKVISIPSDKPCRTKKNKRGRPRNSDTDASRNKILDNNPKRMKIGSQSAQPLRKTYEIKSKTRKRIIKSREKTPTKRNTSNSKAEGTVKKTATGTRKNFTKLLPISLESYQNAHSLHTTVCSSNLLSISRSNTNMTDLEKTSPAVGHGTFENPHWTFSPAETSSLLCICPACGKTFKDIASLSLHKEESHPLLSPNCTTCGKHLLNPYNSILHRRFHSSPTHLQLEYEQEIRELGPPPPRQNDRLYKCDLCPSATSTPKLWIGWTNFHNHLIKTHPSSSPFHCEICGKPLKNKDTKGYHKQSHMNVEERLAWWEDFKKTRPNGIIGKGAKWLEERINKDLQDRERLSTKYVKTPNNKITLTREDRRNKKMKREKSNIVKWNEPAICSICGKVFKTIYVLRGHEQRKHFGERPRPTPCPICGRLFKEKFQLPPHVPTHFGEEERRLWDGWNGRWEEFLECVGKGLPLPAVPKLLRVKKKEMGKQKRKEKVEVVGPKRKPGRPRKGESLVKAKIEVEFVNHLDHLINPT
ncbi:unnamed protein product [Orchesella dallaii]|uniref:C2H2-type domain-containing protein n=1 Tax=Orchesella dallaii TaxID=48710 RepID=A0ABP1Q1U3_9HEXA